MVDVAVGPGSSDRLVVRSAERARRTLRSDDEIDVVSDGLVVTIDRLATRDIEAVAGRLAGVLAEPIDLPDGQPYRPVVTVGYSTRVVPGPQPVGAEPVVRVLEAEARLAMAERTAAPATTRSGSLIVGSDSESLIGADRRLRLARELERALAEDAIDVHYQPIVATSDRRVVGFEALARWAHPVAGLRPPSSFLPTAGARGLLDDLDGRVAAQACGHLARWSDLADRPLWVSVNVGPAQLDSVRYRALLDQAVGRAGVDPSLVRLEVGADGLLADGGPGIGDPGWFEHRLVVDGVDAPPQLLDIADRLGPFGVSRVKLAPAMADPRLRSSLAAILDLAAGLEIEVVVQGVESLDEVDELIALGATTIQGFGLGRPVPADRITAALAGAGRQPAG